MTRGHMPNGKPGDHPYTDIITYRKDVYSPTIAGLVREIARLSEEKGRRALADILYSEFHAYDHPDLGKFEAILPQARDALLKDARQRAFEV